MLYEFQPSATFTHHDVLLVGNRIFREDVILQPSDGARDSELIMYSTSELPWGFFLTVITLSLSMRDNALDLTTHVGSNAMPLGGASLVRIAQLEES